MRKYISKLTCILLVLSILISQVGFISYDKAILETSKLSTTKTTSNEKDKVIEEEFSPKEENYFKMNYAELENVQDIFMSEDYIFVVDNLQKQKHIVTQYDNDGDYIKTFKVNDADKFIAFGDYLYLLRFDYDNNYSNLYQYDPKDDTEIPIFAEDIIYDVSAYGRYLYVLRGGIKTEITRYFDAMGIQKDNIFGSYASDNTTQSISAGDDFILFNHSPNGVPTITALDKIHKIEYNITKLPSEGIDSYFTDGNHIYILNYKGLYVSSLRNNADFKLVFGKDYKAKAYSYTANDITSIALDSENDNSLLVYDNRNAHAIKRFRFTNSSAKYDDFLMAAYTADLGAFHTPTDTLVNGENVYYVDSENQRIVIRTSDNKLSEIPTIDSDGNAYTPIHITKDYSKNIFISSEHAIYKYSSSFNLLNSYTTYGNANTKFLSIRSITASPVSNELFIIEAGKLLYLDESNNKIIPKKTTGITSVHLALDMKNMKLITADRREIIIYDMNNYNQISTFKVGSISSKITDLKVDYLGNIYTLETGKDDTHMIEKYVPTSNNEYKLTHKLTIEKNFNYSTFDINHNTKEMFFAAEDNNLVFTLDKSCYEELNIAYYYDIAIPSNLFVQNSITGVKIGKIISSSNRLIYPLNPKDKLYPQNYSIIRARKMDSNELVIVADYTKDDKYAYVIYNNAIGFMDKTSIDTSDQLTNVPFSDAVALHENIYVYKYPLITVMGINPLYSCDQLRKDKSLTVIDRAADYTSPSGLYWYKVSYQKDGLTLEGYIPRFNIVEKTSVHKQELEYGQIDAEPLHGYVDVYADINKTPLGKRLSDGTKVLILQEYADFYYIEEVIPENSDSEAITGYIQKSYLTTAAQTKSQTTALILIGILVVVVIALIIIRTIIKNRH